MLDRSACTKAVRRSTGGLPMGTRLATRLVLAKNDGSNLTSSFPSFQIAGKKWNLGVRYQHCWLRFLHKNPSNEFCLSSNFELSKTYGALESLEHNSTNIPPLPPNYNKLQIFGKSTFFIMLFPNTFINPIISNISNISDVHFSTI